MLFTDSLWHVLCAETPDLGEGKVLNQSFMQFTAEVNHSGVFSVENDWRLVVRDLTLRLGVNSNQTQILPNLGHQFVHVPFVLSGNGDIVGDSVEEVELLDGDGVDLVQHVNARHVNSVSLNNVDQVVHSRVALEGHISVVDFVLVQD